jgi:NAD(P)-dependent dehydrogenase (short-subunit alcohol dehydrogenase family)
MQTQEVEGKGAVVTGGAGGIGLATAELLVAEGASVVIGDIDDESGQALADQIGAAAAFKQTDVSDAEQVQALVDFAVGRFGGLDIMFNNAGIGSPLKRFLPDDLEDFTCIMNVNLFGVIVGSQRVARYVKDHGGGSIINNASIAAINAGTGMARCFEEIDHPVIGSSRYSTLPMQFSRGPQRLHRRHAPLLGEHKRELLGELGLSPADIDTLEADGIIGGSLAQGT